MEDAPLRFVFLGDLMMGGEFVPYARNHGLDLGYPFADIEPFILDSDILLVNLEGPIYEGAERRSGVTSILRNHPSVLNFLKKHPRCVVSLSNNHIMDCGEAGLEETRKQLKDEGIAFFGCGRNLAEAMRETIVEVRGKRIAFLGLTTDDPHVGSVIARQGSAGCAPLVELEAILHKVRHLKQNADFVCVCLHWGWEYFSYPSPDQRAVARSLADAGATFVVGHHPHVIQGLERYGKSLMVYSLGNFLLPPVRATSGRLQPRKPASNEFAIVRVAVTEDKELDADVVGGRVDADYRMKVYIGAAKEAFVQNVEVLSRPLGSHTYEEFWNRYREKRARELDRESLFEAAKKLSDISWRDLASTLTIDDFMRNLRRLISVILGTK